GGGGQPRQGTGDRVAEQADGDHDERARPRVTATAVHTVCTVHAVLVSVLVTVARDGQAQQAEKGGRGHDEPRAGRPLVRGDDGEEGEARHGDDDEQQPAPVGGPVGGRRARGRSAQGRGDGSGGAGEEGEAGHGDGDERQPAPVGGPRGGRRPRDRSAQERVDAGGDDGDRGRPWERGERHPPVGDGGAAGGRGDGAEGERHGED